MSRVGPLHRLSVLRLPQILSGLRRSMIWGGSFKGVYKGYYEGSIRVLGVSDFGVLFPMIFRFSLDLWVSALTLGLAWARFRV